MQAYVVYIVYFAFHVLFFLYCPFQLHFLKTDFDKWRDEDDSDAEDQEDFNLDEV